MLDSVNEEFAGHFTKLGQSLRERREQLGLSQRRLAERVGIRHTHVSRVERGESGVSLSVLSKLADVLQVPPQWLIGESLVTVPPPKVHADELTGEESELIGLYRSLGKADRRFLTRWLTALAGTGNTVATEARGVWKPLLAQNDLDPQPDMLAQSEGEDTLTVTSHELESLGVHPGDTVATRQRAPHHGDVVIAVVDDVETTFRVWYPRADGKVELAATTPRDKSLIVGTDRVAVQGIVTHVLR